MTTNVTHFTPFIKNTNFVPLLSAKAAKRNDIVRPANVRDKFYLNVLYIVGFHGSLVTTLAEIAVVDRVKATGRFSVSYLLHSSHLPHRTTLQFFLSETDQLPSLHQTTNIGAPFVSAAWQEREAWDMFGIIFSNHPQLGRILTDYSFLGHPLRRDYPLSGFTAVYYDSVEGRVMNEPVSLAQELRLNKYAADARRFIHRPPGKNDTIMFRSPYSWEARKYLLFRRRWEKHRLTIKRFFAWRVALLNKFLPWHEVKMRIGEPLVLEDLLTERGCTDRLPQILESWGRECQENFYLEKNENFPGWQKRGQCVGTVSGKWWEQTKEQAMEHLGARPYFGPQTVEECLDDSSHWTNVTEAWNSSLWAEMLLQLYGESTRTSETYGQNFAWSRRHVYKGLCELHALERVRNYLARFLHMHTSFPARMHFRVSFYTACVLWVYSVFFRLPISDNHLAYWMMISSPIALFIAYLFSVSGSVEEYCRGFREVDAEEYPHVENNWCREGFISTHNLILGLIWWPLVLLNGWALWDFMIWTREMDGGKLIELIQSEWWGIRLYWEFGPWLVVYYLLWCFWKQEEITDPGVVIAQYQGFLMGVEWEDLYHRWIRDNLIPLDMYTAPYWRNRANPLDFEFAEDTFTDDDLENIVGGRDYVVNLWEICEEFKWKRFAFPDSKIL